MGRRRKAAAAVLAAMVIAALATAVPAAGQTSVDEGVRTVVSLGGTVSGDAAWRWAADSVVQSRDGLQTLDLALEHVRVTRDVARRFGVGFGYAVGAGFRNRVALLEQRLTQQVTWTAGVHTRLSLRSLLEERFISGRGAMRLRARQQVRVDWPLAARLGARGIVSAEVFAQADSRTLASLRLDGSRFFVGMGWTMTPASAVQVGYLYVRSGAGPSGSRTSHLLSASLALSLPKGGQS